MTDFWKNTRKIAGWIAMAAWFASLIVVAGMLAKMAWLALRFGWGVVG